MDIKPLSGPFTLTIPNGQQNTPALVVGLARAISIYAPGTLTGTALTLQVRGDINGTFVNYQSGGTDITLGPGKGCTVYPIRVGEIRLQSNSAEGANRDILVSLAES